MRFAPSRKFFADELTPNASATSRPNRTRSNPKKKLRSLTLLSIVLSPRHYSVSRRTRGFSLFFFVFFFCPINLWNVHFYTAAAGRVTELSFPGHTIIESGRTRTPRVLHRTAHKTRTTRNTSDGSELLLPSSRNGDQYQWNAHARPPRGVARGPPARPSASPPGCPPARPAVRYYRVRRIFPRRRFHLTVRRASSGRVQLVL